MRVRTLLHVAAMGTVAAGAALAVLASGSPQHPRLDLERGLLVSTRTEFQVCVEVPGPLRREQAVLVDRLGAAVDAVRAHPDWEPAGLGAAPPSVTLGCPPAAAEEPGPYRLRVAVLDEATADERLGRGVGAAASAAEYLPDAQGHPAEVTTEVQVRASYLASPSFASGELTAAVGLAPSGPPPAEPDSAK